MTGQIGDDKIHEVRERMDIVELVSGYVSLKRSGTNHMGLCPFHSEKSPSFSVNAGRQFFHCFGCGVGGDAFSFLMKMEGLSFPDAVRRLAERTGIELEERRLSPEEERRQQEKDRLFRINEIAASYFHHMLMDAPAGEAGRQYLKKRGYGRKGAADYQIGFAPDGWEGLTRHLEHEGVGLQDARVLGLIRPRKEGRGDYDLFRQRLMFPIFNLAGRIVAFGGRVLDDSKPKYINSPESPIYHKGSVLFGLYQARQSMRQAGEAILVEGYFDQLALNRSGVPHAVATCGTALTPEHAKLLKRYVQRVLLLFDQDTAGRKATFKAMDVLQSEGLPTAVIDLAAGEDPDSFLQREGPELFQERLGQARSTMELFIEETLAAAGNSVEGKARAAEAVVGKLALLPSELEQDLYLKLLAEQTGIALELLQQQLAQIRDRERKAAQKSVQRAPARMDEPPGYPLPEPSLEADITAEEDPVAPPWDKTEKMLIRLLFHRYEARQEMSKVEINEYFHSPQALKVSELLLTKLPVDETVNVSNFSRELDQEQLDLLQPFLRSDPGEFLGDETDINKMLSDIHSAIQQQQKDRHRKKKLTELRKAEIKQDGNVPENLLNEFNKLK